MLRSVKLGEADKIVTIMTQGSGKVRGVAKGIRKTTSRFGARLEPFTHVDLQIAEGRSLDVVTQAETLAPYGAQMGADYERYTAGTAMLETAERLVVEDKEPALQHFLLLVGALRAICDQNRPASQVLDAFLLRSLSVAGYAPSFWACASCGLEGPHRAFSPAAGGALCTTCRVPGSANPAGETLTLLGALLAGEWDVVHTAEHKHRREARGLVSAYVAWPLERGLRSMPYVSEG